MIFHKLTLGFLFLIVLSSNILFAKEPETNSKEQNITEENNFKEAVTDKTKKEKFFKKKVSKKTVVWNEVLNLKDFYVFSEFPEVKNKINEYKETLKKEYKEHSEVFSSAISFGSLLIDIGEIDKAEVVWNKALKDFHANDTPKVYKAWVDAINGKYHDAKEIWFPIVQERYEYVKAGSSDIFWLPYHIDAVLGLYLIKDHLPQSEAETIKDITRTIAGFSTATPKFAAILVNEMLKEGNLEAAANILGVAINQYPEDSVLINLLGITQLMKNEYDLALKIFDQSIVKNPFGVTNHLMKARTYFALGKKKEAYEEFDKLLDSNPKLTIESGEKKKYLSVKSYLTAKKI